jgi:hypothetical protein
MSLISSSPPNSLLRAVWHALLFVTFAASALAQTGTSSIRGQVRDPQSQAIRGAHVTITDERRSQVRSQTTDSSGAFSFVGLPPAVYQAEFEAAGFKKLTTEHVIATVNETAEIPVQLEVGAVTESVSVTAAAEPLRISDATLGNAFESRRIEQLPLNARNLILLLSLQPGVTRTGEVNGARRDQANVTLDGVDNNYQVTGLDPTALALGAGPQAFGSVLRSTPDSVEEFRVVTANPNAGEGRSSGAQVALVTRSGTNQFHGSAYEFHRNTVTTANDWFNNQAGRFVATDSQIALGTGRVGDERVPRPKLIRNVFGASAAGPVLRNRLYFFFNYEGRRDASETSVVRGVPTLSFRQGILQYQNTAGGNTTVPAAQLASLFPGTGGLNPAILPYLQSAPAPNYSGTGDGLNLSGYRFNAKTPASLNADIAKMDYRLSASHSFFVRGNYQNDKYTLASEFPSSQSPLLWAHPKGLAVGHDWVIDSRKVNNARFGLTRQSFSQQGDADQNVVRFFSYRPTLEQRSSKMVSTTGNFTDDFSAVFGSHTFQAGGNVRLIQSNPTSYARSFDLLSTNFAFYPSSGAALSAPFPDMANAFATNGRAAVAILLGRLTQYTANVLYDAKGQPLPPGSPAQRSFATQEYDAYAQDSWRLSRSLTLVYGLRYSIARPVYERYGFQAAPTVDLADYLARRQAGAFAGQPYNAPISVDLSGPANGRASAWDMGPGNLAPNVAIAWSPRLGDGAAGALLGRQPVLRAGFRMLYDRFGSSLISYMDANNSLGFFTTSQVSSGVFNLTNNLPPLFTGQTDTRGLPLVNQPVPLGFPRTYPADGALRTDSALDSNLTTPRVYSWNVTYGRELTRSLTLEASYIGRSGRNLLASRDALQYNNLRDPASGQTWYQAAGVLGNLHNAGLQLAGGTFNQAVPAMPFFDNLFAGNRIQQAAQQLLGRSLPALDGLTPSQQAAAIVARGSGLNMTNWVTLQQMLNSFSTVGPNAFRQPQYSSLLTYSTIGSSDYNGGTVSLRQRFSDNLIFDFNYTLAKSFDTGSTLEGGDGGPNFGGLVLNAFNVNGSRAVSDFDVRHSFNANFLAGLPVGRGRRFGRSMPKWADAFIGGWQLTGIWRYNSGLPVNIVEATGLNAVASQQSSRGVRLRPLETSPADVNGQPYLFSNPVSAYQSFRNALPGEPGDRNVLRLPHYTTMDVGLGKSFHLPFGETHILQLRWEVFNLTNTQPFGLLEYNGLTQDPFSNQPIASWGRFNGSQTPTGESRPGRVMQFGLRYSF